MLELNVKADMDAMRRDLQRIQKSVPTITSRAMNELAAWARKQTIDQTAKELNLPRTVIAKTTRKGVTVDRFRLTRATSRLPIARLSVISAGIQVTDVAGAWVGRKPGQGGGVKARGSRFYRGAFKGKAPGGKVRVFKRREERKLFLPRIGTRKSMLEVFDKHIASGQGVSVFRQRFARLAAYELAKLGIR